MSASCDPAELAHVEAEIAKQPSNIGVGVINVKTGGLRLFAYDETVAFSRANPVLQVMAGHEAAAAMAGIAPDDARGFVLGKQGGDWHIFNQSHLNWVDAQPSRMRMDPQTFSEIVAALQKSGVQSPVIH